MHKLLFSITFSFIFSFMGFAQDSLDCTDFKTGHFETYDKDHPSTMVVRTRKFQKEYVPETGVKIKLGISWMDDCTYKLKFVKANKKFWANQKDRKVHPELIVKIVQVNGNEYYHESWFTDVEDFVYKAKVIKTK